MQVKDTLALKSLSERLKNPIKQVNNAQLHAGSPMFFYCTLCGYESDRLPESYTSRPKRSCKPCQELKDANPEITETSLKELAQAHG